MFDIEKILAEYGLTNETYEQLLLDCQNKVGKVSDLDWDEILVDYNIDWNPDTARKAQQVPLLGGAFVKQYYEEKYATSNSIDSDSYTKELQIIKRDIQKEKIKLQTEKLEYNKWLREEARDEMIMEKICDSISTLPLLNIPEYINPQHNTKGYALVFGDEHFGVSFELKDLFGNIINAYSPEIFEERMWILFNKTIELIKKENITELNVFNMGDYSDGILRCSQLMKLKYGVVDGTIYYANFITNWLNELTKHVRVKFQMTDGNHSELRMLNQPKGTFTEDNMGKVVREFIKVRLNDNPNFTYIENPTGYIYAQIACNTVLCIHGEVKNMENTMKNFSQIYNVPIQYLLAGHLHHSKVEEVGINAAVINVPSVIGVDGYSLSLQKTSNAAGKLLVFDQCDGLICEHTLKLN